MYGLKPDVDLSFFVGRELTQVSVAPYNIQFNFDGPVSPSPSVVQSLVSLTVQSRVEHSSKGVVKEWDGDENMPLSAASLLGLLGSSVVSVQGVPDGTLTLEFSNGDLVRVFDTEGYEAYQICNEGKSIYV
ncbi:MAG: hypothetical protein E8D49_10090 [Nitrospira sp.]|nr:MAG: hypothetical protein E8D49_10090 [Nitrospira sp.]